MSGQHSQDELQDLAEQLEEWARLNDGVSFGDPSTVALCRAAAAMLRADEDTKAEHGPEAVAEARSIAIAILEQRALLEQGVQPEDDSEQTVASPVPLARRQVLTVEAPKDDDAMPEAGFAEDMDEQQDDEKDLKSGNAPEIIEESPAASQIRHAPIIEQAPEIEALEAAEDLDPDSDFEPAQEAEADTIPWFALPEENAEEEPLADESAEDELSDESVWESDSKLQRGTAAAWHESAPPAHDAPEPESVEDDSEETPSDGFDMSLVPDHGPVSHEDAYGDPVDTDMEQADLEELFIEEEPIASPSRNRAKPDQDASADPSSPPKDFSAPGSLFPSRLEIADEPSGMDFSEEPATLKPSLQDEINRLMQLLDKASEPAPPPPAPPPTPSMHRAAPMAAPPPYDDAPNNGRLADDGVDSENSERPPIFERRRIERRRSRMADDAAPMRQEPARRDSSVSAMTLSMYRKPLREELNAYLDELRTFNFG